MAIHPKLERGQWPYVRWSKLIIYFLLHIGNPHRANIKGTCKMTACRADKWNFPSIVAISQDVDLDLCPKIIKKFQSHDNECKGNQDWYLILEKHVKIAP